MLSSAYLLHSLFTINIALSAHYANLEPLPDVDPETADSFQKIHMALTYPSLLIEVLKSIALTGLLVWHCHL